MFSFVKKCRWHFRINFLEYQLTDESKAIRENNIDYFLFKKTYVNQFFIDRRCSFGRDYYINQSKAASGERLERARSAMSSVSSRPSSSLSQQSSCTGDEQREQQVSQQHELERFEGASLRDSLSRRRCRDPRASPHFAINPLLHLELARSSANDRSDCDEAEQAGNLRTTNNVIEDTTENRDSKMNYVEANLRTICEQQEDSRVLAESLETGADFRQLVSADWKRLWDSDRDDPGPPVDEEPIVPQYDDSREESPCDCDGRDHDSGMCSIGSRDSEMSERDRWRKLYQVEDNDCHDEQISSIGGRRFWTTGKYHTYGGIRIRPRKTDDFDDFEDELIWPENHLADHDTEFAKLKFQTFGGIKRSRKVDKRKIPNYRRIRLRPLLSEAIIFSAEKVRDRVGTEASAANSEPHSNVVDYVGSFDRLASSTSFEGLTSSTSSTFEESDWQDEEDNVTSDRVSARHAQIAHGRNRTARTSPKIKHRDLIRKNNIRNSSSLRSLPTEDDEWQDEIDCAADEIIMNKFLKDVSKRRKAYAFSDDDAATRERGSRSRKHREAFDKNSNEGLRKSRKCNENNLESSEEQKWRSDNNRHKKLNVRSLNDVTIW